MLCYCVSTQDAAPQTPASMHVTTTCIQINDNLPQSHVTLLVLSHQRRPPEYYASGRMWRSFTRSGNSHLPRDQIRCLHTIGRERELTAFSPALVHMLIVSSVMLLCDAGLLALPPLLLHVTQASHNVVEAHPRAFFTCSMYTCQQP